MASTGSMTTEEKGVTATQLLELKSAFLSVIKNIEEMEAKQALEPPQTEQEREMPEVVKVLKLQVEKSKDVMLQMVSQLEEFIQELEEERWRSEQDAEFVEEELVKTAPRVFNKVEEIEQKYALIPPQTLEEVQELVEMRALEHQMEETVRRVAEINIRRHALLRKMEEKLETTRDMVGRIWELLDTIQFKDELLEVKGDHDELVDGGDAVKNEEDEDGILE